MGLKELFGKPAKPEGDGVLKYEDVRTELAVRLMKAEGIRQIAVDHGLTPSVFGKYVKWTERWRQSHGGKFPDHDDTYEEYMCGTSDMVPEFWDERNCIDAMRQYLNMRELMSLWDPAKALYAPERDTESKRRVFQDGIDTSTTGLDAAYHAACEILDEASILSYGVTPKYVQRHDPAAPRCADYKLAEDVMLDYSAETGKEIRLRANELSFNDLSLVSHVAGQGSRLHVSSFAKEPKTERSRRRVAELKRLLGLDDTQRGGNEFQA